MFLQRVDHGQQARADLERRNPKSRVAVVPQWVATKFQNLSIPGGVPVGDAVEVGAWYEPRGLNRHGGQKKAGIKECWVFAHVPAWVISLSSHPSLPLTPPRHL